MTQVSGGICSLLAKPQFGQVITALKSIVFPKNLLDEYADGVNRACDECEPIYRVCECANVFECNRLRVRGVHHHGRVHVHELSFYEHGHVHVLHSLKTAFLQP